MSKNTNLVPKRRFKEFQNADDWEQRKVVDVAPLQRGFDLPKSKMNEGDYPVVMSNGINGYHSEFKCKAPGVVTGRSGTIGNLHYIESHYWPHNTALWVTDFKENDPLYIYYMYQKLDLNRFGTGSGVPTLNRNDVHSAKIYIPKSEEQSKISILFRTIDNLITLHQCKLEKTKILKSAYLSELFPIEGEREPKRRFDGFTDDWVQYKVKEICSISTGKSNTQDRIEDGAYPFYVRSPIIERSNRYLFDEEAVLTVGDGVGTGKVFHYVNGKYDLHQRVYRMFNFCNGVFGKYFYYYFYNHFYDRVMAMTAKTSVDSVRYEMISEMDIQYPSAKEQIAITTLFEQLDNLIILHQRELEKLQNIKKSFLNEMFI